MPSPLSPRLLLTSYISLKTCHSWWTNIDTILLTKFIVYIRDHSLSFILWILTTAWCASCFSHVWLFGTLWIIAHQAPLSVGFSRQEYWSGLSCPPPEDLLDPGMEPRSLDSPVLAGGFFTTSTTWKAHMVQNDHQSKLTSVTTQLQFSCDEHFWDLFS